MNTEKKEQAQCNSLNHHGHAIKRLRQNKGLSQKELASLIGMSLQRLSCYEAQEVIDDDILKQVAKGLNVSIELIKELSEDKSLAFYVENNTFSGNSVTVNDFSNNKDASNDKSVYHIDETQKALLEEIRKSSEEARLQYENIIAAYKELLESYRQEIRELKGITPKSEGM